MLIHQKNPATLLDIKEKDTTPPHKKKTEQERQQKNASDTVRFEII